MKFTPGLALLLAGAAQGVFGQYSPGCGTNPPLLSGDRSINVDGIDREYNLWVTPGYDNTRGHMIIFAFQAQGTDPLMGRLENDVRSASAIIISPTGINDEWPNENGRDIAFVDAIIDEVRSQFCIDDSQIFAAGFGIGGSMANALACARADVFRAVASLSGDLSSGCDGGTAPVPWLGMHGTWDHVIHPDLGRQVRDRFVQNNGCQPLDGPEPQPAPGGPTAVVVYTCQPNYPVSWVIFEGGHSLMGSVYRREVWYFFQRFGGAIYPLDPIPAPGAIGTITSPPLGTHTRCSNYWGQCDGEVGWRGQTCCEEGECQRVNRVYSQCL